jgi:hypothetical protein
MHDTSAVDTRISSRPVRRVEENRAHRHLSGDFSDEVGKKVTDDWSMLP